MAAGATQTGLDRATHALSGGVGDSVPTEFIAEVRLKEQEGSIVRNLLDVHTLPKGEGGTYEITELTRAIAYALTEGVDMAQAQEITDSSLEVSPAEIGAQVVRTDLAEAQISKRANLPRLLGQILGNSIITKEDVDLLSLVCDGHTTVLGAAGTSLTSGYIMAAGAAIRAGGMASGAIVAGTQEPAPDPIHAVFNDTQLHNVNKELSIGIASLSGVQIPGTDYSVEVLKNAKVARLGGVNIFKDNNIGKDANDDAKGGVFAKRADILVRFGGGPKMEPDRDPSGRWTEMNIVVIYGTGQWKNGWGREMVFDAASPTS